MAQKNFKKEVNGKTNAELVLSPSKYSMLLKSALPTPTIMILIGLVWACCIACTQDCKSVNWPSVRISRIRYPWRRNRLRIRHLVTKSCWYLGPWLSKGQIRSSMRILNMDHSVSVHMNMTLIELHKLPVHRVALWRKR